MVMTQQIEGWIQTISGTITAGGTSQLVTAGLTAAQIAALPTIQGVTITTNSTAGLFFGWESTVSSTEYRRKQVVSSDAFEWSISVAALKQLYVIGATTSETYKIQLMR